MTELLCCAEGFKEVILLVEADWEMMGGGGQTQRQHREISVTQFINKCINVGNKLTAPKKALSGNILMKKYIVTLWSNYKTVQIQF